VRVVTEGERELYSREWRDARSGGLNRKGQRTGFYFTSTNCRGVRGLGAASHTQCLQSSRKLGEQRTPVDNVDLAKCVPLKGNPQGLT
jgi:hypothetical protein